MANMISFPKTSGFVARSLASFFVLSLALMLPAGAFAQKALVLDATTVGGANSNEAKAAVAAGFTVGYGAGGGNIRDNYGEQSNQRTESQVLSELRDNFRANRESSKSITFS